MKKLLLICMAALTMASCSDKEPNLISTIDVLIVYDGGSLVYEQDNVKWRLVKNSDDSYTLYMDQTRFMEEMPYLDMEVQGLENQYAAEFADMYFKFDADEMVPVFNGQNMTQYALTDFHCDTDEQALNVRFKCMGHDVRYRGSL